MTLTAFTKGLPGLLLTLALLGMACALASTKTITGTQATSVILFLITATAVAGTITLVGPSSNVNLIPHLVIILAIIAAATVLGIRNTLTGAEVTNVIGALLGGGTIGVGFNIFGSQMRAYVASVPPPTQGPPGAAGPMGPQGPPGP